MLATEQLVSQVEGKGDATLRQRTAAAPAAETEHRQLEEGDEGDEPVVTNHWTDFWFFRLFMRTKFIAHRVFGLAYLIMYFTAIYQYFNDYQWFLHSPLVWALPLTGVLQSVTASLYFTFLPRAGNTHGYFSDKRAISYDFVVENIFFASILAFAWLYFSPEIMPMLKETPAEYLFVFFPYVLRQLFPKTSFRDQLANPMNTSGMHYTFFQISTAVTRIFYVWGKHGIGYFMNYVRFLERITPEQQYHMYLLLIFSCCATTIAMFLHTLKFKRYIDSRVATTIYIASYMATFYSFARIVDVFFVNYDVFLVVIGGIICNYTSFKYQQAYQVLVFVLFNAIRYNYI